MTITHVARRVSALLAVLAVVALASMPLLPTANAATGDEGVDRFGACLAANKSGQVLFLMDESFSLRESDPQAARVTASKYLAEQLQTFAADTGAKLDVAVSSFAANYRELNDWQQLSSSTVTSITDTLGSLQNQNSGQDTDYWAALTGAQKTLAKRKPANGASGCQMVAWFTDGALDFNVHNRTEDKTKEYAPGVELNGPDDAAKVSAAAKESICRSGGVADQLRSSGVITIGIGLDSAGASASTFDLMKSIATGQTTSTGKCGDITSPVPGGFYPVSDIDDLLFAFDRLSTPGQPPIPKTAGACARTVCEKGKHKFVLDRSVGSVAILASADRTGLVPVLVAPNGSQTRMVSGSPGSADVNGVKITYRDPSSKTVSVRMTNRDAAGWRGVWALVYIAPDGDAAAKTRSSIHITGDLLPAWPAQNTTKLHSGDTSVDMTFAVKQTNGTTIDAADIPGKAALSAQLVTAAGKTISITTSDLDKAHITDKQTFSLAGVAPGNATLRMTLKVTTAPARESNGTLVPGTVLSPQNVDLPVTIAAPVGYPQLSSSIDFGTVEAAGSKTAAVKITGPGCVWRNASSSPTILGSPDGAGTPTVDASANAKANCVTVAEGRSGELPLTLTVPNDANGTLNGTVSIMVAPTDGSAPPVEVRVPFTASLQKNLDVPLTVGVFIAALILGPLIPLLLLYLVKWFTARIPAKALRSEQIRVQVNGNAVLRDGAPFALRDTDLVRMVPGLDKPARDLDLGGGVRLRARIGLAPFGTGFVVATAPGSAGAAGKTGATHGKTPDAKLPLAVHNSWFVLHDPNGPANAATVVVLAGADATPAVRNRIDAEIASTLPRILGELRTKAAGAQPNPPGTSGPDGGQSNPFGGGQPPPPLTNPFAGPPTTGNPFGPPQRPPHGPYQGPPQGGQYPRNPYQ
ncbi:hypothetical protein GOEFS_096_00760 [Gordonia effusa NBRC 100432]|uniref:VWFA domain-containing protein n=1 Tax=Gordonia effusa NBRC 100432 TaxID=1077974 RepID=H0R498_9ACTN|nr:VWA domain-containing protein [Gordonia effusa]GAB19899.1 hypothetical protein GOEFS_096_00760 [Gordonia effusa NBRC 100432]